MIKVMIADDEILEREVYKVMLNRHFPELKVVAEAETGRQAIEMYDAHKPELIFMDVKMPGINGIEAIEEIRKRSASAKFVVISAYNFFDYAKEALKYGLEDYLLKPVIKDEFIKVVGKVAGKIEEEKKTSHEGLELREKLRSILPILESEITFAIMMGDDSKIRRYSELSNIDISSGYVVIGMVNEDGFADRDDIARNLAIKNIQQNIKENMPELKPCLISSFIANKMVMVFPWKPENQALDIRDHIYKKILKIRNAIKDSYGIKMYFGIGEVYNHISEVLNSYNQALTVVNNIDSFGIDIVNYADIKGDAIKQFHYPYELEKQLVEKVRLGITEEALRVFASIFDYTREWLKGDVNRVKFELLELYFALSRMAWESDSEYGGLKDFVMSKSKYYNLGSIQEIYHIFEEDIRNICGKFREERNRRAKKIIFLAVEYVKENYMREITLEEVAKKVSVSPNYFSRMFKNEFNQSFIDYLTHMRVEIAKDLIVRTGKNISSVCWDVGYNDPNYFTKVFKKVTGFTPSEFKEKKTVR